ncbi:D(5)-like dopamine receptor [Protopterus annectens]|uniref:D(5)-like dopamine receptor n=1 Tax=Protopterus annectens TaxID=7888 RepID=UPI001CFBC95D|nr:D(5)-like dopamine receptor [Protopterus annectens]
MGLATALIVTMVTDIVGNTLVISSVLRNNKLRNTGNIFVVSLAVSDLLMAVYPYPLSLLAMFQNGWILGDMHCKANGFVLGLSVVGSVFNITAIAINRYCFICHSKLYDKLYSLKNTYVCVGLTWLLAVAAVLPTLCIDALQYDPRIYSCVLAQTVSSTFTIVTVTIHFIVPIIIVVFCYIRIWALVIAVRYRVRQDSKQKLKPHEIRNFFSMFMVFVIFAVCWGPLNFTALAVAINPTKVAPNIPAWFFSVTYFMAYFNGCLNGLLYGLLNQNFRKEYARIFLFVCSMLCCHMVDSNANFTNNSIQLYTHLSYIGTDHPGTLALAAVLVIIIVLDVVGNVLVILSVFRNNKLRNTGNTFVVSLSVADLLIAIFSYPLTLRAMFYDGWTLGEAYCKASGLILSVSVAGSVFSITAIAINRYCYICHNKIYKKVYNGKNTCCWLGLTWIITFAAVVPHFIFDSLQYDPRIFSCTLAQSVSSEFTITIVTVHFIFPICIVLFCYTRIWALVIRVKYRARQDSKQKLTSHELRQFFSMFMVFVLFALCWGPLNFIGLAVAINPKKIGPHIPIWLFCITYYMAYFNSCLNGVLYGLLNQNFRKEYIKILMSLCISRLILLYFSYVDLQK